MPPLVAAEVADWAYELATTLPDELCFKVLRDAGKKSPNGRLSRLGRWAAASESNILDSFDYKREQPTAADQAQAIGSLFTKEHFHCDGEDPTGHTTDYAELKGIMQDKVEFPTIDAYSWNLSAFKWSVLGTASDLPSTVASVWLSLLAPVGSALLNVRKKAIVGMVVHSTAFGVATLPLRVERHVQDKQRVVFLAPEASRWDALAITNLADFEVQCLEAVSPIARLRALKEIGVEPGAHQLTWRLSGGRLSLVRAASLKCFPGVTVKRLNSLVTMCKVPYVGVRPKGEHDLCELLLRWCWPDWTDEQVRETLAKRNFRDRQAESILESEGVAEVADGIFEEEDQKDMEKEIASVRAGRAAAAATRRAPPQCAERPAPGGAGSDAPAPAASAHNSSGSSAAPPPRAPRPKAERMPMMLMTTEGFTREDILPYLPPVRGVTCCREQHWATRWRVQYPSSEPPYSTSKAFLDVDSERRAVQHVVTWCWQRHLATTGEGAPFDINAVFGA